MATGSDRDKKRRGVRRMEGTLISATLAALFLWVGPAPVEQQSEPIRTELQVKGSRFKAHAPIIVDVWVENETKRDLVRNQFSPISSSVGLPDFVFVRVPDGKPFSIPPGLFGDDWDRWYQPVSGKGAFAVGKFNLPSGKRIHLLHGDLRLTLARARGYCQRALDEKLQLERPDNASTKKHYQEVVRFVERFLSGGTFDVYVRAYSKSEKTRLNVRTIRGERPCSATDSARGP